MGYILVLTTVAALILAFLFSGLKGMHDANEANFKRQEVLEAISVSKEWPKKIKADQIEKEFQNITQIVMDVNGKPIEGEIAEKVDLKKEFKKDVADRKFPMFIYDDGSEKFYIFPVRGKGLWDAIWGYIALKDDLNTVAGASFGHQGETPGLGAEIKDNTPWKKQFIGRKIKNDQGEIVSIKVVKGGAKNPIHEVDGIAGATVTTNGVTKMIAEGLEFYKPYFDSLN